MHLGVLIQQVSIALPLLHVHMTTFKLTISIDEQGLNNLHSADMSVTMFQADSYSDWQIIAVLAEPQQTMDITWDGKAAWVYISNYTIEDFKTLYINTSNPALYGNYYTYNGSQISLSNQGSSGSVHLTNQGNTSVTAGLANKFSINNRDQEQPSILTAESLLLYGMGTFPANNNFYLTAIANSLEVGMVIPKDAIPLANSAAYSTSSRIAVQPPLLLSFSTSLASQSVQFDAQLNQFVLQS
jgi:hypothetical protein